MLMQFTLKPRRVSLLECGSCIWIGWIILKGKQFTFLTTAVRR